MGRGIGEVEGGEGEGEGEGGVRRRSAIGGGAGRGEQQLRRALIPLHDAHNTSMLKGMAVFLFLTVSLNTKTTPRHQKDASGRICHRCSYDRYRILSYIILIHSILNASLRFASLLFASLRFASLRFVSGSTCS